MTTRPRHGLSWRVLLSGGLALAAPGWTSGFPTTLFGGDCAPTLARLVIERVDGRFHVRERPADITSPLPGIDYDTMMFDPGDLVVTR